MNMDISFVLQKGNKKDSKNLWHFNLSLSLPPNDYNTFKQIKTNGTELNSMNTISNTIHNTENNKNCTPPLTKQRKLFSCIQEMFSEFFTTESTYI